MAQDGAQSQYCITNIHTDRHRNTSVNVSASSCFCLLLGICFRVRKCRVSAITVLVLEEKGRKESQSRCHCEGIMDMWGSTSAPLNPAAPHHTQGGSSISDLCDGTVGVTNWGLPCMSLGSPTSLNEQPQTS